MRKLLVIAFFLTFVSLAKSQNLTVEGTAPNLYITHTVAPKENFYSIARLYNQPPKAIASYNKITMEKGLTIGQKVKIPLNEQNFDVSDDNGASLIPITHIVSKSETLFKLAGNNRATAQLIKKWNSLSSDNITPGTPLVIGHLKSNGQATASAAHSSASEIINTKAVSQPAEQAETRQAAVEAKKEDRLSSGGNTGDKQQTEDSGSQAKGPHNGYGSEKAETSNPSQEVRDTALAVVNDEPKNAPVTKADAPAKTDQPVKEKREKKPVFASKKADESKKANQEVVYPVAASSQGAFAHSYDSTTAKTVNKISGLAATFKSTSGWQDKKYYVLISDVTPGTILKISSGDNKIVFAKVLGSMPEMKENEGLLLRMSNAAASDLGIVDPKFPVQVSYYQ